MTRRLPPWWKVPGFLLGWVGYLGGVGGAIVHHYVRSI